MFLGTCLGEYDVRTLCMRQKSPETEDDKLSPPVERAMHAVLA